MKLSSLLNVNLFGFAVYLSLELVFGSYGFLAQRALEDYLEQAERQYTTLAETREELQRQIYLLTTDAETIRLEARDIGFIAPEEAVVRVDGHKPRPPHSYIPGATPPPIPETKDNRALFRTIALAFALVALLMETLRSAAANPHTHTSRRKRTDEGDAEVGSYHA